MNISEAIEKLNPAQKEAVVNTRGPMLVIAGAGSGKTRVLTTRIALLLSQGVPPERILALTFTRKAAEEMRSRIIEMQGDAARRIMMGTFHSVFIRFLRPFAERLGFQQNFTILDEDDSLSCMKRCVAETLDPMFPPKKEWNKEMESYFKEQMVTYKPKTIAGIVSAAKNNLITVEKYYGDKNILARDTNDKRPLTYLVYAAYRNACFRSGVMDYDDILLYTDILLDQNSDVTAMIAGSYDYILVDEYQDTNYAQYSILKRLTWLNKNICCVGDDSQSIYAFRGAKIDNILNFQKEYQGCRLVRLEQNYRSTKNIVTAANNLISRNEKRIPKVCFTDSDRGEPITLHTSKDEKGEAAYIANCITDMVHDQGLHYNDFAVLYRTNAQSRALEDALVKGRVPYTIYSGISFFTRMEIKDLLCYFRLAVNPRDDEAVMRVINKPVRGLGDAALKSVVSIARAWNCSIWDAITHPQFAMCGLPPRVMEGVGRFIEDISDCIKLANERTAYNAATAITDLTGFYNEYLADPEEESQKRADNIRELVDSAKAYEEDVQSVNEATGESNPPTLAGYLENIMLLTNADTGDDGNDKVSLMTVHCAKGLEYDTVFVAGMEKKLFPLEIDGTEFEREEERRLFYVAVTRAKRQLVLTNAETRLRFGKREHNGPSEFIKELSPKKE